ncbi:MAG: response regulator, partial [Elusimicrobia bacterium]|nr:response regulator [Elusimicrobiota bacterium]
MMSRAEMTPGEAMAESSVRVLMIEDDPAYSDLVRLHLADPGLDGFAARVDAAPTLAEGLRKLEEGEYDAVLSDLGLPDAQGLEAVSAVLTRFPDVPLLVCTNTGDEALALEAVRRGAQDFLRKSEADARWLRRAIRYAIERKAARRHDEMKDRWIAVLSHELRTPLTVIKGVLADLAEGGEETPSPRQQLMLGMARRHVDRIARMVVNLLDLSRLESG